MRRAFSSGVLRGSHSRGFSPKEVSSQSKEKAANTHDFLPFLGFNSFSIFFNAFPFPFSDVFVEVFFFFFACAGSLSTFDSFRLRAIVVEGRGELSRLRPLWVLEIDEWVVGMTGGSFSSYISIDEV